MSGSKTDKDNDEASSISADTDKETNEKFGILIVKLVKSKHDKGLGLTVSGELSFCEVVIFCGHEEKQNIEFDISGGVDRGGQYPVISHLRLGGIADRSESLVVGDTILAVNKKKTENLIHQEVVDLLRNAGQHVSLKIQYKIPKPDLGVSSTSKTAIIQLKKEAYGFGIVARESPETSVYGYRPLMVASIRQGSAAQSRGIIHVGDRLLAINGQGLVGLPRDDAVLLLKHAHDQVSLQIEYDVFHKEPISTNRSTWIVEIEKPLPTVSLGLILVEDRSGVIVISDINEGGVADRSGAFHKNDQIVAINGTFVKDYSLSQVVDLLAKSGSRLKIEFLSVHRLNDDEDFSDKSRHTQVDNWVSSQGAYCNDQLSDGAHHDQPTPQGPVLNNVDARHRLQRELPRVPCGSPGYDNTNSYLGDVCPYEEISDMINQTRGETSANETTTEREQQNESKSVEGLYSKVMKPRHRSNSLDPNSTGRSSPWSGGTRGLGSRQLSFNSGSLVRRRKGIPSSKYHGFRRSGSLQSITNTRLCRVEYVEVNLTADSQGFGLTIAEGVGDGHNMLIIADIECGGPAERSGVLQVNDEVLGINDTDVGMMSAEQCNGILQSFGTHANIFVGFTVAESIVATSGTFSVKLRKHYFGLGITFSDITRDNDEKSCIIISHVRKGSMAYRTGLLHIGDRLVALNGRKMTHVEDAIALIDAMPLGEIVSVTVHKEEELEDEDSGVIYTVELSRKSQGSFGVIVAGPKKPADYNVVASLIPGTVAERSGAVHVGDRILAINDVLVKTKTVKDIYEMLDYSGDVVKLRLQSSGPQPSKGNTAEGLELPDMTSLHRVSAWAEIFNELDQIVASSKSMAGLATSKKHGQEVAKGDGSAGKTGPQANGAIESKVTASVANVVKSGKEDFWENFDAFWDEHMSLAKSTADEKTGKGDDDEVESNSSVNSTTITVPSGDGPRSSDHDPRSSDHDSSSGTLKGKCISVRYVVREKFENPEGEVPRKLSFDRSSSMASGYETDCSTLPGSLNEVPQGGIGGGMSRADTEPFTSMDSFDISNDADDKIELPAEKKSAMFSGTLETRTFSLRKSEEHGFGFSLMPDKFKQEVYIASILPGGPCDGILQPLDKITKIDDQDLTQLNIYEIIQILHHRPTTIQVSIIRNPFNSLVESPT